MQEHGISSHFFFFFFVFIIFNYFLLYLLLITLLRLSLVLRSGGYSVAVHGLLIVVASVGRAQTLAWDSLVGALELESTGSVIVHRLSRFFKSSSVSFINVL